MKDQILSLLKLEKDFSWANAFIEFVDLSETDVVNDLPGRSNVGEILPTLKIRSWSAEKAGIGIVGMVELQKAMEELNDDQVIQVHGFKGKQKTGIVYLDNNSGKVIGAILIDKALS